MESESITMQKMYHEIMFLRKEVEFIKHNMVKEDIFLSPLEEAELEETLEAHKKGKTISLEEFKKELGD